MKQNWQIKKLGEVCEINIGRTPERGNSRFWDKEKKTQNIWLSIADLNNAENGYVSDSSEYVSDMAVPKMKLVKANTLLMSFKLTIGRCAITKRDLFTNEAIAALPIQTKDLDLFFLKYYLESFNWDKLTEGDTKVKGKTLNKKKLNVVPIVVPPLEEQKRIVAVLDKKFAQIETLITAAEKNLQNNKQLFQEELEKAFSNDNSKKVSLSDVCDVSSSKRIYAEEQTQSGVPFLRVSDLVARIQGIERNDLFISKELFIEFKNKGLVPKENDVLVTSRGTLGLCYIVKKNDEFYFQDGMITWLSLKQNIDAKFLTYLFESELVKKQIKDKSAGAAVSYISISEIRKFEIILPALEEQKRIVTHLDSLSEKVHQLEEIYTKQLADCDELKQSLLQKAFDGELS